MGGSIRTVIDDTDRERDGESEPKTDELTGSGGDLSMDTILDVVAHRSRREILQFLGSASDRPTTVDELVEHLRNREAERSGERPSRDRIEAVLRHTHLPKLAAVGVIEYDSRSRELRYWRYDRLEETLEFVRSKASE